MRGVPLLDSYEWLAAALTPHVDALQFTLHDYDCGLGMAIAWILPDGKRHHHGVMLQDRRLVGGKWVPDTIRTDAGEELGEWVGGEWKMYSLNLETAKRVAARERTLEEARADIVAEILSKRPTEVRDAEVAVADG